MANCVFNEDSWVTSSNINDAAYWESVFPCDQDCRSANKRRRIDYEEIDEPSYCESVFTLDSNLAAKRRRIDQENAAYEANIWTVQTIPQYCELQPAFAPFVNSLEFLSEPLTFGINAKKQELEDEKVDHSPTWEDFFQFMVSQDAALATEQDIVSVPIVSPRLVRGKREESSMVVKGSQIRYSCTICTKTFPTNRGLKLHLHSHKTKPVLNKSSTRDRCSPEQHKQYNPVSNKPFTCPLCDRGFSINQDRLVHLVTEACTRANKYLTCVTGGWDCNSCNKSFISRDQGERHVRSNHEAGRGLPCPICPEDFTGFKGHVLVRHV